MKPRNLLPLQLFAACLIGLLLGKFCFSTSKEKVELSLFNGRLSKLQAIINIIDNKYVDHVDIDSLNELVIPDLLSRLDPHTSYVPAKRLNDAEKKILGYFYGIGIEHFAFDDTSTVINVIQGSPASHADIKPGDKILQVDSTDVTGSNARNLASTVLKGEFDTEVTLFLKRHGCDSTLTTVIRRGHVPVPAVISDYMIDETTAYIKLESFSDNSYIQFASSVLQLKKEGAKKLIIDLRDNLGGRLEQARLIASEIIDLGDTITYTIGRENVMEDIYTSTNTNRLCDGMSIACIVDSHTASAAEILSAAIQDNDRGAIIGRRTFGKGLVQTPIQMQDGSQVNLTTYRYYAPSGRSLQKSYKNYNNDLNIRTQNGELDSAAAFHPSDTTKYFTKHGRTVYAKSGVMPDIFVPLDNTPQPYIAYKIDSAYITMRYVAEMYNKLGFYNPREPEPYINALFDNEQQTYDDLIAYAIQHGVNIDTRKQKKEIANAFHSVMDILKADAYYVTGNTNKYIMYINESDTDIKAAVEVLNDDERLHTILNDQTNSTK